MRLAWRPENFHNPAECTGGITVAFADPVDIADNNVTGMQVAGKGCAVNIPVILR